MADRCVGGRYDIHRLSGLHEACGCDHYPNRLVVFYCGAVVVAAVVLDIRSAVGSGAADRDRCRRIRSDGAESVSISVFGIFAVFRIIRAAQYAGDTGAGKSFRDDAAISGRDTGNLRIYDRLDRLPPAGCGGVIRHATPVILLDVNQG